ncbi:MAG TPA: hypothetical protein VNL14_14585 [Candidatus Acidoferrales bacterium]|nr:hypothetical protein [Candidatus Acidoferrales bacterium]
MRPTARTLFLGLLALSFSAAATIAAELSRQSGDRLQRKIDAITSNAAREPVAPLTTRASEEEVNSYLAFNVREKIPQGLSNPKITMMGNGWLAGRVVVDLDEFKRRRGARGVMDPFNYLSGNVPVTARGFLRTSRGKGRFHLDAAEILGVPVPQAVVQELVSFFSRTPENPDGFDLDAPFNLPAKIREIVIERGEAVIVQ